MEAILRDSVALDHMHDDFEILQPLLQIFNQGQYSLFANTALEHLMHPAAVTAPSEIVASLELMLPVILLPEALAYPPELIYEKTHAQHFIGPEFRDKWPQDTLIHSIILCFMLNPTLTRWHLPHGALVPYYREMASRQRMSIIDAQRQYAPIRSKIQAERREKADRERAEEAEAAERERQQILFLKDLLSEAHTLKSDFTSVRESAVDESLKREEIARLMVEFKALQDQSDDSILNATSAGVIRIHWEINQIFESIMKMWQ